MRSVLFARIGWMTAYAGPQEGDERPEHGGSYNKDNVGHEVYNFSPAKGWVFGFVQPPGGTRLNLRCIDPDVRTEESVSGVLVAFVSWSPIPKRGLVIVGWYNNATVFRRYQEPSQWMLREDYQFLVRAKAKNAVLLPEALRRHQIPSYVRGGFGRVQIAYAREGNGSSRDLTHGRHKWIGDAIEYIRSYDGPNMLGNRRTGLEEKIAENWENERVSGSGQGYQIDSRIRRLIERYAVARAEEYFGDRGYEVADVGGNEPYDLKCTKGKKVLHVEVKGTQSDGTAVILTMNEVSHARNHRMALYVLHSITLDRTGKSKRPSGGVELILNPWDIERAGHLKAISYEYEIKST